MPSLAEIKKKRHKKFIKKSYRIWNLNGENNNTNIPSNSISPSFHPTTLLNDHTNKHQSNNNQTTNRQQIDNNQTVYRQHKDNNQTTQGQQSDNTKTTYRTSIKTTIGQQLNDVKIISDETFINIIKSLSGLQEKLFYLILEYCNLNNDTQTGRLKTAKLASLIGCSYRCIKTIMERVTKKNIIKRLKGKSSIAGFVQFEMLKEVKTIGNKLLFQKRNIDKEFNNFITIIRQHIGQQLDNSIYSSSSYININTTTTDVFENFKSNGLDGEWLNIDIEPLSNIGFTKTHLTQIVSQNLLPAELVQNSIYAFAFDLQENDKAKNINGDPINYFMGILRKGKPYAPTSNYESPQDKAMRLYKEKMKEVEQRRVTTEKEAISLAYSDWFSQLTSSQKLEFLPESIRRNANPEKNKMLDGSARNHFEVEIWPNLKKKIIEK